jgi:hypothetical protein
MYIDKRTSEFPQGEVDLNEKGYSERDEKRILDALGRGLLTEFPNPNRTGCPGSEVLKKIASHAMPLTEAEKWLDHLTSCSPCYREFSQIQATYRSRRTRTILAIAASILVVAGIAGWVLLSKRNEPLVAQTAVLDLRNRSVPRGGEPNPGEQPLEFSRGVKRLHIYLPLGSSEGVYEVRVITPTGKTIATAQSTAYFKDQVTSLDVEVALSSSSAGDYILQLRRPGLDWSSYSLHLR